MPQNPHLRTPQKSQVIGAGAVLDNLKESGQFTGPKLQTITDTFDFVCNKSHASHILKSTRERRTFEAGQDPRGGYRGDEVLQLQDENLDVAADIIENYGFDGHDLDSGSLRHEANLPDISEDTLRRGLQSRGIGRFIARTEVELSPKHARIREDFAEENLAKRPKS